MGRSKRKPSITITQLDKDFCRNFARDIYYMTLTMQIFIELDSYPTDLLGEIQSLKQRAKDILDSISAFTKTKQFESDDSFFNGIFAEIKTLFTDLKEFCDTLNQVQGISVELRESVQKVRKLYDDVLNEHSTLL